MDRSNIYESAFEAFLQWNRLCYIATDEKRRTWLGEEPVKSLDFIVYGDSGSRLLIDVKGHRFPGGPLEKPRRVLECWTKDEDIEGLLRWQNQFGAGFHALLVFAYQLTPDVPLPNVAADLWTFFGHRFLFTAILVEEYQEFMRRRSPKWGTMTLPSSTFRSLARPFQFFTQQFSADTCLEHEVPF